MDEDVPKLPRGRGIRLSRPELFRIAMTLIVLVAVILFTKPCAHAVSSFVTSFDNSKSAKKKCDGYVKLTPGMTDEQTRAAIEKAKADCGGSGVGSAP